MAEAAVAILLEEVEVILKWHKNLISDSENELEHLKEDLSSLKAFLRDADVKSKEGATFRDIERQIRDVVYDVEDTIDTCLTAAAKSKSSIRPRLGSKSVSLAIQIKNLRGDKVKPIIDRVPVNFASAGVAHGAGTSSEEPPLRPRKIQLIRRDKHVGFGDEEAKLIRYLTEQKEELDVISIIGMPGLGKTTLAWKIFEDEEIRYVFPTRIWVSVTQRFNSRNVFRSILRKFTNTVNTLDLSDEQLVTIVGRILEDEKFLLVMDDVWSCDDWNIIKRVLPKRNGLSKVMITSRESSVGAKANVCREPHMLRSKATKQNIFQEITKNKEGVLEPPVSEETKFSRICFNSDLTKFLSGKPNGQRIRSFLSFYKEPVNLDPEYISNIPDAFGLLRVLESMSIKFPQFPEKLIKLIHLRYITLNIDDLTVLAEPLSQLWNLQTLVVETKSRTITMKANIWRMYRLRNLKTKAAIELDKKWEGEAGENLHTMTNLSPESCTEDVSRRACNLKTLGIQGDLSILFATTSLQKFDRLEKLKLVNDVSPKNAHTLQPNCFPPNLKRLTLSHTFLEWRQISSLAKINTLEVLKLKHEAFIGSRWTATGEYCFPNLRLLLIDNTDLVLWEVSTNFFPSLQYLVLKNCENLTEIPRGLTNTLEKLDINRLRKSAVESALKIMEKRHELELEKVKQRVPFKLYIGPGCEY
ncbi:hypothetical protein C2S52_005595 [Perilla frutescens var. hirtella]|nr:hypothetical protein C2S52_005595 [Perilla frutescens var. hirtella]